MLIAEALNRLKDLESDRQLIRSQLLVNLYVLPDLAEGEKPLPTQTQLEALRRIGQEISRLKVAILRTNLETFVTVQLPGAEVERLNLMQVVKRIELLRNWESLYNSIATALDTKESRYFSLGRFTQVEPVKLQANFEGSAKDFRNKASECRASVRIFEQALAKANWQTAVIE